MSLFDKYIKSFTIHQDLGTIEFFNNTSSVGSIQYIEGDYDFQQMSGVEKIYTDEPSDAVYGSFSIQSTSTGNIVKWMDENGQWVTIFKENDNFTPFIVDDILSQTEYEQFKPLVFKNMKVFNECEEPVPSSSYDDIFNVGISTEYYEPELVIPDMKVKSLSFVNNRLKMICSDFDDNNVVLHTPINSTPFTDEAYNIFLDSIVGISLPNILTMHLGLIAFVDGNVIKFYDIESEMVISNQINLLSTNISSMQSFNTTLYVYYADGSYETYDRLSLNPVNHDSLLPNGIYSNIVQNDIFVVGFNTTDNKMYVYSKVYDTTHVLDSPIDTSSMLSATINNDFIVAVVDENEIMHGIDFRKDKTLCMRLFMDKDVFKTKQCELAYLDPLLNRAVCTETTIDGIPVTTIPMAGGYGVDPTAGFSYCSDSETMVFVDKHNGGIMVIVDTSAYGPFSRKNPSTIVNINRIGMVGSAIYNGKIYIAFSDRYLIRYGLDGTREEEMSFVSRLPTFIQDITSSCGSDECDGFYFLTKEGMITRFTDLDANHVFNVKIADHTDRSSIACLAENSVWASSVEVTEERIYGFDKDGNRDYNFKILSNNDIVKMDSSNGVLYTIQTYYPYKLSGYVFN